MLESRAVVAMIQVTVDDRQRMTHQVISVWKDKVIFYTLVRAHCEKRRENVSTYRIGR